MSANWFSAAKPIEVPCTIEIEHTADSLHAYMDLQTDLEIGPGDEVRMIGDLPEVPFGEKVTLERRAIVTQASALSRFWTKLIARFELTELYDVSFSSWRRL